MNILLALVCMETFLNLFYLSLRSLTTIFCGHTLGLPLSFVGLWDHMLLQDSLVLQDLLLEILDRVGEVLLLAYNLLDWRLMLSNFIFVQHNSCWSSLICCKKFGSVSRLGVLPRVWSIFTWGAGLTISGNRLFLFFFPNDLTRQDFL